LAKRHAGVLQKVARNLEPDFIGHFAKGETVCPQVPAHGATVHREQASNRGSRTGASEQFSPKQSTQISRQ